MGGLRTKELGDDYDERRMASAGDETHTCAKSEPATCRGRMGFWMKRANKNLFITRPPKADLQRRGKTLRKWLKLVPTLHAGQVSTSRYP